MVQVLLSALVCRDRSLPRTPKPMPLFVRSTGSLPTVARPLGGSGRRRTRSIDAVLGLGPIGLGSALAVFLFAPIVLAQTAPKPAVTPAAKPTEEARPSRREAPPVALATLFQQWDRHLSQRKLAPALELYAPNFSHGDGLTRKTLGGAIEQFWQLYPNATYETTLLSWTATPQGWVVESSTRITGRRTDSKRAIALDGMQRVQTTIENGKLIRQEVLGEINRVTSGEAPPTLEMRLAPEVQTNQDFSLDVIVQEPLQTDLILGAIRDEPVQAGKIAEVSNLDIKPLIDSKSGTGPGGIFKIGRAPAKPENRWISAIVLRKTGMTFLTQRLRIVDRLSQPPKSDSKSPN
jgi:hypothetical protein